MNLFANLSDVFNSDVVSRIATYIDEPAEKTSKAVDGLVYTIIGGLMKRTTSEIGVNQLYKHVQKGHYDGALLDNLSTVLRDPSHTNTLITHGDEVISHLLPAMKSSIGTMISSYANIRNSSAISLLGLTTTLVLHVLGKQVKERKLDADGLATLLFSERDALVNAVPDEFLPRLIDKVGLQQIVAGLAVPARRTAVESSGRSVATPTRPAVSYDYTEDSDNDNGNLTKWGFGALVAMALAAGGYYIYQNTQKYSDSGESVSEVTTVTSDTVQADTVTRSLAVPKEPAATTPKSASVAAGTRPVSATVASSLTQSLTPYLTNPTLPKGRVFRLPGVTFIPGSLSMTAGSRAAIGELATLLKTYPQLQVQLMGYANDAMPGTTNRALSFKRVNLIKQELLSAGIHYLRVDAVGRGTGVPLRDTSRIPKPTLRQIDLKVVVK
jgi:outer membrane protein OmpA-like peptidoglycan-associated protein